MENITGKFYLACLRYSHYRFGEDGVHATYMGHGATYFETPKELLDAYIARATATNIARYQQGTGYEVRDQSFKNPTLKLDKLFLHYYLPITSESIIEKGHTVGEEFYVDGVLFATVSKKDGIATPNSLFVTEIAGNNPDPLKLAKGIEHATHAVQRSLDFFKKQVDRENREVELSQLT